MSTTAVPNDEILGQVRQVWADVLGSDAESVPLDVNFLEAGGNSLLLVMLWEQLQPLASRQVKLSELFQHGSVRAQAELLSQASQNSDEKTAPEHGKPTSAGPSLLAQRRAAGGDR